MTFIPQDVINQVLERSDIVEVVSSYIPLKNAGRNFKAPCPFHHEKTPSFVVSPDKQIYHCFGCDAGGNVISFVMQQEHMEFPEAVRMLAQKVSVTIPEQNVQGKPRAQARQGLCHVNDLAVKYFHRNLLSDKSAEAKAARDYLKGRGITLDVVEKFHVGFALEKWDGLIEFLRTQGVSLRLMEKAGLIISKTKGDGFYDRFRNRIIFPIFNIKKQCVAFGARTMEKDNPAKYLNSPETEVYVKGQHLYGMNWAKEAIGRQDSVIVVEGYVDFMTPFQAGVENIVASSGTALTVEQIRLIRRYTHNVVMLFDADQAGEKAMIRSLDLLVGEGMHVRVAALAAGEDPDSFVRRYGIEKFKARVTQARSLFDFKLTFLKNKYDAKSVEGRAEISAEMLATISRFPNAIIRSEYIKKLAQALFVSQEALLVELKKISGKHLTPSQAGRKTGSEQAATTQKIRPVERNVLRLMLEEESFIPLTKAEVLLADFRNEHVRNIVEKIYEFCEQGNSVSIPALMSCFDDQKISQVISSLMTSENALVGDKKKIHQDCVNRLLQERMKSKRQEILHQMEAAKSSGDQKRLEELALEFNQLLKRE
ncbi:MAG: DNA primase [Candidatus Omnitrophica bacterium]|nr:DNA primase [Candidatus Omnitrophota bacterium]